MPAPAAHPAMLQDLDAVCLALCAILEREHAVLRQVNGLIGQGVPDLEALQAEKQSQIERLEFMSRADQTLEAVRAQPEYARTLREGITRCKQLQSRNHQVFSRIVAAQRRIVSVLRETDEDVSLYDRGGRARDYGVARKAGTA
jgi:flagellar biosynthesis/type III secretory pathway chaperone